MSEVPANRETENPCGEFGATQQWAVVWFICVVLIGVIATANLMKIDTWMYENNAEVTDTAATKENRLAATSISSGGTDERQGATYPAVLDKVE